MACANGTEAIALALQAAGVGPEDEVLLPANTCVPTLAGVRLSGARPRLCDVDPDTLTMDAASAEAAWSPAVRFLLPVHLYGGVADCEGLLGLAARRGATLVEDCAQSHGASWGSRMTGGLGTTAAFSFYPTKNLGAYGDGGAVATGDAWQAERLRQLRQYGWSRRDFAEREGWNSRLDEIQAAILRVKLATLGTENERRRQIADRYDAAFEELPLRRLSVRPGTRPSRHLYPVRVRTAATPFRRTSPPAGSRPAFTIPCRYTSSRRTPSSECGAATFRSPRPPATRSCRSRSTPRWPRRRSTP